jgi:hypothetical protein
MEGDDEDGGVRFWLPPIRLPPLFPDGVALVLPAGPSGRPRLLAAAVLADGVDAALLLGGAPIPGYARAVGVVALAGVLLGRRGVLAGWELLAAAVLPVAAVFPTLTALLVDLVGLGHPEEIEGDAEREGEPPDERE